MHVCTYLSIHFNLWELSSRLFTRASCFNSPITYPNPHLNKCGEAAKGFGWTSYKAPWQMATILLLSISVIWRSGWILQFWMIKEQQQVSAFHLSLTRKLWLNLQALPLQYVPCYLQAQTLEFTVNQAKPLSYTKEPGHLLPVTFLKEELQPMNFAIIKDTGGFPPQQLRRDIQPSSPWYRRVAKKATESPKMSSLRVWAHFPDTWSWQIYFQRRLQKIRLFSRQMGMA